MTDESDEPPKMDAEAGPRPDMTRLLTNYFIIQRTIFEFFGYVPDWANIPISDDTGCWWWLSGEGHGDRVVFGWGDVRETIESGGWFSNPVYTQCHLSKWVYRTATHTMVCSDTRTDLNRALAIFDNEKEVKDPELIELIEHIEFIHEAT